MVRNVIQVILIVVSEARLHRRFPFSAIATIVLLATDHDDELKRTPGLSRQRPQIEETQTCKEAGQTRRCGKKGDTSNGQRVQ